MDITLIIEDERRSLTPARDGLGLLTRVRAEDPHIPGVAASGRDAPRTEAEAQRLGGVACLRRPLDVDELVRILSGAIAQAAGAPAAAGRPPQLARLEESALAFSSLIRWDSLEEFLEDIGALFQRVTQLIAEALEVEIVSLMLADESDGRLRIAHAQGAQA
jgi:CheY-like chemotaxis protein